MVCIGFTSFMETLEPPEWGEGGRGGGAMEGGRWRERERERERKREGT